MHAFADSGERDIYDLLDTHDIIPMVYYNRPFYSIKGLHNQYLFFKSLFKLVTGRFAWLVVGFFFFAGRKYQWGINVYCTKAKPLIYSNIDYTWKLCR